MILLVRILSKRIAVPIDALGQIWGAGTPAAYQELLALIIDHPLKPDDVIASLSKFDAVFQKNKLPVPLSTANKEAKKEPVAALQRYLYEILRGDKNVHAVLSSLKEKNARQLDDLAKDVFPDAADSSEVVDQPRGFICFCSCRLKKACLCFLLAIMFLHVHWKAPLSV